MGSGQGAVPNFRRNRAAEEDFSKKCSELREPAESILRLLP
jgi:hypothetical protein